MIREILEGMAQQEFYHVTTKGSVSNIMSDGITSRKQPVYKGLFGQDLRTKNTIYAFGNYDDALRWAFKMNFDLKKDTSVVIYKDDPSQYEPDTNPQIQMMSQSSGVKKKGIVPASSIVDIIDFKPEMGKQLVQSLNIGIPVEPPISKGL